MRARRLLATLAATAGLVAAAGCADNSLRVAADAQHSDLDGRGPITFVQGKDNSGVLPSLAASWNATHPDEKVTILEQTDQPDQQHQDLVQRFQARDAGYDVVAVDLVWTAEFAARGWLQELTGAMAVDTSALIDSTVEGASYRGRLFAMPTTSDGGLLFYRKDLVATPPRTWDEMMAACTIAKTNGIGCYGGQFAQYEGLTVSTAEAINTAGGSIVADDGVTPTVDSPQAKAGLRSLATAFAKGDIPRSALTFQEEQARQAFQTGKLLFMRNWPYAYKPMTENSSPVTGKFGVATLPGKDGVGRSTLGGHNAAISVFSDHKATARDFLEFLATPAQQRRFLEVGTLAPARSDLYDDPALRRQFPYLDTLRTSIRHAVPRPVSPYYSAITRAVQSNVYSMLQGRKDPDTAADDIYASINAAGS
ncbi:ABC transporter substrate-binding protein [Gordonia sinesedis]